MATTSFFDESKNIANDFLQNIVFIDDRAYEPSKDNHDFDAAKITNVFAKNHKVCAVYKPESVDDINYLSELVKKSDITVLDWQINLQKDVISGDDEQDADADDPRGPHTLKIINEILNDPLTGKGSLKLIVVYTGEIDLYGITDDIYNNLSPKIEGIVKGDCEVHTENVKILITAKSSTEEEKFKHTPELNKKVVTYEDLPDFILKEFTKMTMGLLSNFVLKSLTTLRENTFLLVKLYNQNLDPSFLSHRFELPFADDSKEQLIEILTNSIEALLNYNNAAEVTNPDFIKSWHEQEVTQGLKKTLDFGNKKTLEIDSAFIQNWLDHDFVKACEEAWIAKHGNGQVPTKKFKEFKKDLTQHLTRGLNSNALDAEFSILTHHKSNLKQPSLHPRLSLGTIIKSLEINKEKEGNDEEEKKQTSEDNYYLCIQAKCDSVRLSELRKFLFIPLNAVESQKFNFVVADGNNHIKLALSGKVFDVRTIKFNPDGESKTVKSEFIENDFIFTSNFGEKFKWIADLKDAHAQRVANNFASLLSRVGLDESEWLRKHSGN